MKQNVNGGDALRGGNRFQSPAGNGANLRIDRSVK
jgi:hypothetical protein